MAASAHFSLSTEGTLVYMSEDARARRLVWVDRQGSRSPALEAAKNFDDLSLSPDGTRLAVGLSEKGNFDIWIAELARGALTRLTNDPRFESTPLWAPDGARVAFRADTSRLDIFWVRADGSQPTELLYESEHDKAPDSWAHDGRALAFVDQDPETGLDIWVLTLVEKPRARPFLKSRFQEGSPRISPDGRWVAYVSDETGRAEVYVTSFPDPGGKVQVSTAGGVAPRWARNGSEIFFVEGRTMMAAAVRPGATFSADKPIKLFETAPTPGSALVESYDVAPDGRRFIMMEPKDQGAGLRQIHVVLNWFTELEARAPTGR